MPIDFEIIFALCAAAFLAGFVDSIVGGGGLIQTPIALVLLPQLPVASVIGSLKIPAFSGTALAATQYVKHVKINYKTLALFAVTAFSAAYVGSHLLTIISNEFMKPILLVVLINLAIYTIFKKDFGQSTKKSITSYQLIQLGTMICIIVGLYDGFIGPATGTFFLLGFVTILGMDFLKANTYAKLINLATNFGSICLFLMKGLIIWKIAVPMAICNAAGGYIGAKTAINKGNKFIRIVFITVISLSIFKFGYDIWST